MHNADWDDLRYFFVVAQAGSLLRAAQVLQVNHSTVLRRLAALEQRLGARLFDRLRSGYRLTAAGDELRARLDPLVSQLESAQHGVAGRDTRLSGPVRVTTVDTIAHKLISPVLGRFRQQHPDIRLELTLSNENLRLHQREVDIAVRPTNAPPPDLIGHRVGVLAMAAYGAARGPRRRVARENWATLDWIGLDASLSHTLTASWMHVHVPAERIVHRVDSFLTLSAAVAAGVGVGLLPVHQAAGEAVRPLSGPIPELDIELWLLTHPSSRKVARIQAWIAFFADELRACLPPAPRERRAPAKAA